MPSTTEALKAGSREEVQNRFVVARTENGWTIELVGSDPETRYLPVERDLWNRILERLRLGW